MAGARTKAPPGPAAVVATPLLLSRPHQAVAPSILRPRSSSLHLALILACCMYPLLSFYHSTSDEACGGGGARPCSRAARRSAWDRPPEYALLHPVPSQPPLSWLVPHIFFPPGSSLPQSSRCLSPSLIVHLVALSAHSLFRPCISGPPLHRAPGSPSSYMPPLPCSLLPLHEKTFGQQPSHCTFPLPFLSPCNCRPRGLYTSTAHRGTPHVWTHLFA